MLMNIQNEHLLELNSCLSFNQRSRFHSLKPLRNPYILLINLSMKHSKINCLEDNRIE